MDESILIAFLGTICHKFGDGFVEFFLFSIKDIYFHT